MSTEAVIQFYTQIFNKTEEIRPTEGVIKIKFHAIRSATDTYQALKTDN